MLTLQVELLCGRYTATSYNNRAAIEWPPHPQRLFSALVATWADADVPSEEEREVLEWLSALGAPAIHFTQASRRHQGVVYVPVNDAAVARATPELYGPLVAAVVGARSANGETGVATEPRTAVAVATATARARAGSAKATGLRRSESNSTVAEGLRVLPDLRGRQGRFFPTVVPDLPVIWYCWPAAEVAADTLAVLDRLVARAHRLGHSSTFVSCVASTSGVPEQEGVIALEPLDEDEVRRQPDFTLRVPGPGLLGEMEEAFSLHHGTESRVIPARHGFYVRARQPREPTSVLGGEWLSLVLRGWDDRQGKPSRGGHLPLRRSAEVCTAVRDALLRHTDGSPPELVAGHAPDGCHGTRTGRSERDHLAVVPLPYVGHRYADGLIHGVALLVPSGAAEQDAAQLWEAVRRWASQSADAGRQVEGWGAVLRLFLTGGKEVLLGRLEDESALPRALRQTTWFRAARTWATVTPIALDRHPGNLAAHDAHARERSAKEAEATVVNACERLGLPRPETVAVSTQGLVRGVPAVRNFPLFASKVPDGSSTLRRQLVHVRLGFAERVRGPVVLGAGRYRGLGLCLPIDDTEREP